MPAVFALILAPSNLTRKVLIRWKLKPHHPCVAALCLWKCSFQRLAGIENVEPTWRDPHPVMAQSSLKLQMHPA